MKHVVDAKCKGTNDIVSVAVGMSTMVAVGTKEIVVATIVGQTIWQQPGVSKKDGSGGGKEGTTATTK